MADLLSASNLEFTGSPRQYTKKKYEEEVIDIKDVWEKKIYIIYKDSAVDGKHDHFAWGNLLHETNYVLATILH